jgi:transcriptional regulator with XRE-family HTH domain
MYLPGTVNERIGDLRSCKGLSQKELSKLIEVAPSQMSRIESGETQKISSDIIIKLAKVFGVSTDYILGLTTLSIPKNYDISELGLSEETVKRLITGLIDVELLNCLIGHNHFPYLLAMVKSYINEDTANAIGARNDVIDLATATLGDFARDNPEYREEVYRDALFIKSHKMGKNEAVLEKIKSILLSILRDIKRDTDSGVNKPMPTATAEFMQEMRGQLKSAQSEKKPVTKDDVAAMVTGVVGKSVALDDESTELFKQLMGRVLDGNVKPVGEN